MDEQIKLERIAPLPLDQQEAEALGDALEKGEFYWPVRYMTREEFAALYATSPPAAP